MKRIDKILTEQLTPDIAPADALNRKILTQAKEIPYMKQRNGRTRVAAAAIVAVLAVGSVSAYAAYRYLTPSQVAAHLTDEQALSEAFESETAIQVNETQTVGGYDVTFLGTVSGQHLMDTVTDVSEKKTYAVVAIMHSDRMPMAEVSDDDYRTFCVSPLIHGKTWEECNNGVLNAGVFSFVQDGIQYELLECDDLEIFSGMGVSLGIVEQFGDEEDAFSYDSATGAYSRNASYEGMNALFELPLDISKADNVSAEAFFTKETEKDETEEDLGIGNQSVDEWLALLEVAGDSTKEGWETFLMHAKEATELTRTVQADADGYVHFSTYDGESENLCYVGDWAYDAGVEVYSSASSDGTMEGTEVCTMSLNADGSYTIRYYVPKVK